MRSGVIRWTVVFVLLALAPSAFAGWTVTIVHPVAEAHASSMDVSDGDVLVAMHYNVANGDRTVVWHNSTAQYTDLIGSDGHSLVFGMSGSTMVGNRSDIACKWLGSADNAVSLRPVGSSTSNAYDVSGSMIAGYANFGSMRGNEYYTSDHAGYWTGDAASWRDLHPAGYRSSKALATDGIQQAGLVRGFFEQSIMIDGPQEACVWTGTADSMVNLNPAGAWCSEARGVWGGTQVGWATGPGMNWEDHAGLWHGTAESWVDLNPAGSSASWAFGVLEDMQVGWYSGPVTGDKSHAVTWTGTAGSAIDLHQFLPSTYTGSSARAIGKGPSGEIWVVGSADNSISGMSDAVIWQYEPVPEPSALAALGMGIATAVLSLRRRRQP